MPYFYAGHTREALAEGLSGFQFEKRLLLRYIHRFKSDLINNMDHMRISGTEPSSVILSKTKLFKKLKSGAPKVSNQALAKWDNVINPHYYNFSKF